MVAYRDVKSWTDLLTLPALVLPAPSRGGRKHADAVVWTGSVASGLISGPLSVRSSSDHDPPAKDDDRDVSISFGHRQGDHSHPGGCSPSCLCGAAAGPPVRPTDDVVASLRLLHPGSSVEDRVEMGTLREVASGAAPSADMEQVRKALLSFPSASGAGKSGLRPSHVRDALRPDLLLRLLSEVVSLLLRGEVPESVRPYICGASIMALRKPNGSLRPIAIGETIRRGFDHRAAREIFEPLQLGSQDAQWM